MLYTQRYKGTVTEGREGDRQNSSGTDRDQDKVHWSI